MTSLRQAGLDTNSGDRLRKVLTVLGVVALAWLVLSSVIWIFTYNGSGAGLEQPGITSPPAAGRLRQHDAAAARGIRQHDDAAAARSRE